MLVNTTNLTEREVNRKKFKERNRIKIENVKSVCVNSYLQNANDTLSTANVTCEQAINNLSYSNKNKFCLNTSKEIEELLRREDVTQEILEQAMRVLKRFCDAYTMTRIQSTCARRGLYSMNERRIIDGMDKFLKEMEKVHDEQCKSAFNSLGNQNKQKFCLNNKDKNSLKIVKRICDAFIDYLNANYQCIAPYLDSMWYDASEEELKEIDSNCIKAIDTLSNKNKENFCKNYVNTIPEKGSLLTREGTIDDNTRNRAINVVKGACSSFFHSRDRREINKVIEGIKMENAANGITDGLNSLASQPVTLLMPQNSSVGPLNATHGLLPPPSLNKIGGRCEQSVVGMIAAIGTLAIAVNTFAFCTMKKYWKKSDSDFEVEDKPVEKQRLLINP